MGSSHKYQVLTPFEAKIVAALGQTMYPRGGDIPLDATQARAVEYVDRWLTEVPAKERVLIRLMFVLFEIAMPALGPRRTRRFSRADPEAQRAYLSSWETSRIYARRMSMYGLRSVFALAYLDDDEVLRHLGVERGDVVLARQRERDEGARDLSEVIPAPADAGPSRDDLDTELTRAMDAAADRPGPDVDPAADVTVLTEAAERLRRRVSGGDS